MSVNAPITSTEATATATAEHNATAWWSLSPSDAVERLGSSEQDGLSAAAVTASRARHGRNTLERATPPTWWQLAARQARDPMNLMLLGVAIVSALIGQGSTAIIVGILVAYNLITGTQQEAKAQRSVDALATMQVPMVRVWRDGSLAQIPSDELVPGDVIELESGDVVPADARILRSSACETQEAALTGESLPVAKGLAPVAADAELGDRTSMLFQNTDLTRGTAVAVVTGTGMNTQMGRIAGMLGSIAHARSPLQRELDSLTRKLGIVAWLAVMIILVAGFLRGYELSDLLFLATAVAISAIPTGLPTFVQTMLSWGARKLADSKAVVASLGDVETLGATSAICSDKTGTLTLNAMTARTIWLAGQQHRITGEGYSFDGVMLSAAGEEPQAPRALGYALALPNDVTVSASGEVIGDPTEAALVVLAAKLGIDADETRRTIPRLAEVPFDSATKFMATFHRLTWRGPEDAAPREQVLALVKGAPDVILGRCRGVLDPNGHSVPISESRAGAEQAMEEMSARGLRTLALAVRTIDDGAAADLTTSPEQWVTELDLVGIVGIVDPLRSEAIDAVAVAKRAGIDVRMITGDHAITAGAIGAELGLGPGAISGADLAAMPQDDLAANIDNLHVFGRVTPQDKVRIVETLQARGDVVAMTGDAVNDAAAIKQADVGVAMGSGSEVTKQAARLVLTDDNFATLVHAVELGRVIYAKITAYIRFQMTQLLSLILLFLAATAFEINSGVALLPGQILFLNFFVCLFPVIAILQDAADPQIMNRPPRDPKLGVANAVAFRQWLLYGFALFAVTLVPLVFGPDEPSPDSASTSMTMSFVVMGLGTVVSGLLLRRDPGSGLAAPVAAVAKLLAIPAALIVIVTELGFTQEWLGLTSLMGRQWLACLGLVIAFGLVVEIEKWIRRRRSA